MQLRHFALTLGVGISAVLSISACSGRAPSPAPLAGGEIVEVVLGDKPVMRAGETGAWSGHPFRLGHVDIYERVIIVTEPDGTKHSAPPDWFSEVTFK